MQLKLKIKTRI